MCKEEGLTEKVNLAFANQAKYLRVLEEADGKIFYNMSVGK